MNATTTYAAPNLDGCTFENDSFASIARREAARARAAGKTPQRVSPYLLRPERESYEERAVRDGVVVAVRMVHRWAGTTSVERWRAPA